LFETYEFLLIINTAEIWLVTRGFFWKSRPALFDGDCWCHLTTLTADISPEVFISEKMYHKYLAVREIKHELESAEFSIVLAAGASCFTRIYR
jgi:hypothetical protein